MGSFVYERMNIFQFLPLKIMSPTKASEVRNFSAMNSLEKEHFPKKLAVSKKVHIPRNSLLTDLMQVNHLESLYNMMAVACVFVFLTAAVFYLLEPSVFWEDVSKIAWGASKFYICVLFWLLYNLFAFAVYESFKLWIILRNMISSKITDNIFLILYGTSFFMTLTAAAFYNFRIGFPPITGLAVSLEQLRIYMKIHSFVRENVPRAMQYKSNKDENQQQVLYPTRKYYLYYLFAPTLIYRDAYPWTKNRQWKNAFHSLFKFISVVFIIYCIFLRFYLVVFKNAGLKPFSKTDAVLIFAASTALSTLAMLMTFYGLLHCWQNAFAELLGFGDREFYQDWWNSTSITHYYRRWNILVHDWLHAYIYTDFQRIGCSRLVSLLSVFVLSALFHEYSISVAFGFFYPVLLLLFAVGGTAVIFVTNQKTGPYWNCFILGSIFTGWGIVTCLYHFEFFARVNCPKEETLLDFFIPRSWDPSCQIFDFS